MNPKKQTCVTCKYEYNESKGEFHPPSECPHKKRKVDPPNDLPPLPPKYEGDEK